MVASRKFSQGKPHVPHTQLITGVVAAPVAILAAFTPIVVLPAFTVVHGPVKLEATFQLDTGGGQVVDFNVLRDGLAAFAVNYQQDFDADSPQLVTMHWLDEAPGFRPVYTLVALSAVAGPVAMIGTRFTAHI